MEFQFVRELNEQCLLFKTPEGKEVIFDKVDFEVMPRESIRFEIQKSLKKIMESKVSFSSKGLLKYLSFEKYQGSLYLVRDAGENAIVQFQPVNLAEVCQALLMILKVIKSYHESGLVLGGVSLGQVKRNAENEFLLQDPLVMHYLGNFLNKDYGVDAPVEVIKGKVWDDKADLFSWGVLAFRLLTGNDPFAAETPEERMNKIIRLGVAKPKDLAPKMSDALNNLILRTLNQQPKQRPSLEELINGLTEMIADNSYEVSEDEANNYAEKAKQSLVKYQSSERFWLWFRKYGFMTIGLVVVSVIVCVIMFSTRVKPLITAQTKPGDVVKYYFQGIQSLDISLLDEAAHTSKNTFKDIITNLYVVNRTQQAMTHTFDDFVKVELSNLKIRYLSGNKTVSRYQVGYSLKIDAQNQLLYIKRQDIFNLKLDHKVWRIISIKVINEDKQTIEKQIDNGN